ncbi:MAG: secretin N-terminal domain-containing protein [Granulosicoccus sp.]
MLSAQKVIAQNISEESFTLNLKNADIHTLIETVSSHTGKNFIVDPRVKAIVNLVSSEPVDASRLYEMFLAVLEINGYAAVQAGQFIKIVPTSVGVESAVPILGEHTGSSGELVSQVIHLKSMSALQVVETLRPLLSESASLEASDASNAIVVTDYAMNIDKLIDLIVLMDRR